MHKTYTVGASIINKTQNGIPEMESRINKLPNITCNGPQLPSETAWSLQITMLSFEMRLFCFLFLESNKKGMLGF